MKRRTARLLIVLALLSTGYGVAAAHYYTVIGRLDLGLNLTETVATDLSGVNATVNPSVALNLAYVNGTSDGQINTKWCRTDSIAISGADTFDLRGGLTNEFGTSIAFAEIEALGVKAHSTNTNDVWIGGGGVANRWKAFLVDSAKIAVKPGYAMIVGGAGGGYAVTANTGDTLVLRNSAGGTQVKYDICIAGRSS